jgi:hypothetical protein
MNEFEKYLHPVGRCSCSPVIEFYVDLLQVAAIQGVDLRKSSGLKLIKSGPKWSSSKVYSESFRQPKHGLRRTVC